MLIVIRAIFPSVDRVRRGSGGRGMVGMRGGVGCCAFDARKFIEAVGC